MPRQPKGLRFAPNLLRQFLSPNGNRSSESRGIMAEMRHSSPKISALFWLLIISTGFLPSAASGQIATGRVAVPGENRATATRLAATARLVADKEWSQAIDEYLQIQEESGDDLVPLDSWHSISARRLCQQGLAGLPTEALRLYRDRVESQAKKWFEQGKTERDARLLRRLVDESFCSRYTDRALDLLGDLAFERGRFEEAESWWKMLAPSVSRASQQANGQTRSLDLVFPDPQVDLARVRAKELLTRLFASERESWADDFKAFRKTHGNQQGNLAGQTGNYADILETIFNQSDLAKAIVERNNQHEVWPTFAGRCSHNFISPRPLGRLAYENPPWPIRLDGQPAENEQSPKRERSGKWSFSHSQPRCYPVIAGDLVFISNARSVAAYDVLTARRVGFFDLQSIIKSGGGPNHQPDVGEWEYTLTVSDNRVFAVLGKGGVISGQNNQMGGKSILVCLDLPPRPDGRFQMRWQRVAGESDGSERESAAFWEGAPNVQDNQVFIALTRSKKNHSLTTLECYDADSGQLRWRREICLAPDYSNYGVPNRSHLLTLAGQCLVYCSDAGVTVAIDAATGRRVWACRYTSRGLRTENGDPSPRGLCPVVYHSGRVFVAPADYSGILCLDALTGEKVWERKNVEVVHLIGVAKGRLIFTTAKIDTAKVQWPAGIRALDAQTGADIRRWIQPADASNLLPFGKGFLAGDSVVWPITQTTENGPQVLILNQEDGSQTDYDPTQYGQIHAGNMAFAKGCLAVADEKNLHLYVPPGKLLELREGQARNSDSATAWYLLAVARADAGQSAKATEAFVHAATLAQPNEVWGMKPLLKQIRADWHHHLLFLADQAAKNQNRDDADAFIELAASKEFATSDRLRALAKRAEWLSSRDPPRAIANCKSILEDNDLCRGWLIDSDGARLQARWWAAGKIEELAGRAKPSKAGGDIPPPSVSTSNLGTKKNGHQTDAVGPEPDWKPPLTPRWQIPLDQKEIFLGVSRSSTGFFFTYRGRELVCREFMKNQPRWVQRLGDTPTWLATPGETVLVAGAQEINLINLGDGSKLWSLSAPPLPSSQNPFGRDLHDFRLVGSVLMFFQGQQYLFGADIETGRVLWQRQASGASLGLPPPAGRFCSRFYAGDKGIVVQTSGGRLWILDPQTGKLGFDRPTCLNPWPRSPYEIDTEQVVVFPDSQNVMLLCLPTRKVIWKKTANQPSVTAEAPQLLALDRTVFQLVDGWQLARLDLSTGDKIWEKAVPKGPINADLSALDSECLYHVNQGVIHAWSLSSHRSLWKQQLPRLSVPWRVAVSGRYLFLFPSQPPFTMRWGLFLNPQPMSFPFEMQWDDMPLLVCDKQTGKIVQEMRFRGTNPHAGVHLSNRALVLALEEKILAFQPTSVR